jgi:hypothetical protein
MAAFKNTHCGEKADAGTEAGAADLKLTGKLAFGRKTVAGVNLTAANERANVLDDLHGELTVARDLVVKLFNLFFHAE